MKLSSIALSLAIGVLCSAETGSANEESLDTHQDHVDHSSADVIEDELNNGSLRARGLKKKVSILRTFQIQSICISFLKH